MMINARSEIVAEKASFKYSFNSKRCLIPASAFYEWTVGDDKKKDPHYIYLPDKEPFFFAGIWAHNDKMDVTSCSILTTTPHKNIAHIHDRMPVILKEEAYEPWISKDVEAEEALTLIDKNRGSDLVSYRIDRAVNKRDAQGENLIRPL